MRRTAGLLSLAAIAACAGLSACLLTRNVPGMADGAACAQLHCARGTLSPGRSKQILDGPRVDDTVLSDGTWSKVGSANLDWRNVRHNQEINAMLLGAQFGQRMRASFDVDLNDSQEITLQVWRDRPIGSRV